MTAISSEIRLSTSFGSAPFGAAIVKAGQAVVAGAPPVTTPVAVVLIVTSASTGIRALTQGQLGSFRR